MEEEYKKFRSFNEFLNGNATLKVVKDLKKLLKNNEASINK
jgi:hypothetical protein